MIAEAILETCDRLADGRFRDAEALRCSCEASSPRDLHEYRDDAEIINHVVSSFRTAEGESAASTKCVLPNACVPTTNSRTSGYGEWMPDALMLRPPVTIFLTTRRIPRHMETRP